MAFASSSRGNGSVTSTFVSTGRSRLFDRRRHPRIVLAEQVSIRTPHCLLDGRLVDLSSTGAAIAIVSGFVPGLGEELSLSLRDGKHLWGLACRIDGGTVAIRFPLALDPVDDLLCIELRGLGVYTSRDR